VNGELAQAIALIAHGNSALRTGKTVSLEASNSTFKFVRDVRFSYSTGGKAKEIASRTEDWFSWLASHQVRRLRLGPSGSRGPLPAHIASSFAGGGEWLIRAESESTNQDWIAGWAFGEQGSPRPWRVEYLGYQSTAAWPDERRSLSDASGKLRNALVAAGETAAAMNEPGWDEWFRQALTQFDNDNPVARFHDDALPAGYTLEARQLYATAVGSWVFGGMGSWNDVVLDDPDLKRRYDEVSADLYSAILRAFEAVLDSGSPA
jgi:hypothetical protein